MSSLFEMRDSRSSSRDNQTLRGKDANEERPALGFHYGMGGIVALVAVSNYQRKPECFSLKPNRVADRPCFICVHGIYNHQYQKIQKWCGMETERSDALCLVSADVLMDSLIFPFRHHQTTPAPPGRKVKKRAAFPDHIPSLPLIHFCFQLCPSMGSSLPVPPQCFGRQRSLHDILGGGFAADVILWRRSNVTIGILIGTVAAWVVFQFSGYTLVSFISNVLLLLSSILFVWAKAAGLLNRPPPPIPKLQLSEAVLKTAADFVYSHVNMVLSASYKIALGKDTNLFYKVAACLWLISFAGGLTDFLTLGYASLVIVLTVPAIYEKYEDYIEKYVSMVCLDLWHRYETYAKHLSKVKNWISEKKEKLG